MLFILGHMINACSGPADATPPLGKIHTSNSYINITFEKIIGF